MHARWQISKVSFFHKTLADRKNDRTLLSLNEPQTSHERATNKATIMMNSKSATDSKKRPLDSDEEEGEEQEQQNLSSCAALSPEQKRMKRVLANRRSAKESRERRKNLLAELEEQVDSLKKENRTLAAENAQLRKQVVLLLPQARANKALMSQQMPLHNSLHAGLSAGINADILSTSSLNPNLLNPALLGEGRALYDAATASLLRHQGF